MRSAWVRSPQEVDPLSWFAGPRLPVVFSIAAVALGAVMTVIYWGDWSNVVLQFVAMPLFILAGLLTSAYAWPTRPRIGPLQAAQTLGIGAIGLVISSVGTAEGTLPLQQWWPGIAFAATLVSLAPYSSALQMIRYGLAAVIFIGVDGWFVFSTISGFWPPLGIVIISAAPVIVAGVASIVFCYTTVDRTLAFLETSAGIEEVYSATEALGEDEARARIARVSARVAPFIEKIAATGVITPADRALAAQIARTLRTELVKVTGRSWLDRIAEETGMIVSDPGRLADTMNESQRAALRGLLVAAQGSSVVDQHTFLIELRAQPDGSTAVALSIDMDLPEGRRQRLLAPYYLTLMATVDDLSWDDGRNTQLSFKIPPKTGPFRADL